MANVNHENILIANVHVQDELQDADGDTKITVEKTADADTILFTINSQTAEFTEAAGVVTLTTDVLKANDSVDIVDTTTSAYVLKLVATSSVAATGDRNLVLDVNNADRTIDLAGDLILAGNLITSGGDAVTLTTTETTIVTLPTTGTLRTEREYIRLEDDKAKGTQSQSATNGWVVREIAEVTDADNLVTVASNIITMEAGTYDCDIVCATGEAHTVSQVAVLYDNDAGAVLLQSMASDTEVSNTSRVRISGRFTLAIQTDLTIQQYTTGTTDGNPGYGLAADITDPSGADMSETYVVAEFWRESA